jgi:allantoin racemase
MKIWYQSFTRESLYRSYNTALRGLIGDLKDPATQIDAHSLQTGGMATQYHYLEHLQVSEVLENVEKAVEQGYDAFAIGHFTDSGLQEAREIASIPVLGLGESSMLMACMMGKKFSLVGINPKSLAYVSEKVHAYGLDTRLASTAAMIFDDPATLEQGFHDEQVRRRIVDSFQDAAHATVEGGSEVVIPAGGVAMAILAAAGIHLTRCGASVLNGIAALIRTAEAAVRMNQSMQGHFTSKRMSYAPPSAAEMEGIRRYYGPGVYRSIKRGA